jgi:hypothetical protein
MIWNPFAIVAGFISVFRVCVALIVGVLAVRAWLTWRAERDDLNRREHAENSYYLVLMMATLLLLSNIISWPAFYLVLQSYVKEWPGVMCIYGVTRIGEGSTGTSRFLPDLVSILEITKPAVVFVSGLWFVLHRINSKTQTAPLSGRILVVMGIAAILAMADSTFELAYLTIPKKEEFPSSGCCTGLIAHTEGNERFLPRSILEVDENTLYVAYYLCNSLAILSIFAYRLGAAKRWLAPNLAGLVGVAIATTLVDSIFVIDVVAPRLLGMPDHHCPYDLVPKAPESLIPVALFVMGGGMVWWAALATWLGNTCQTEPTASNMTDELLHIASKCYLLSLVWTSVELLLI